MINIRLLLNYVHDANAQLIIAYLVIGIVFGTFAFSHTMAHICDFHRLANASKEDIDSLFNGPYPSHEHIRTQLPESYAGRWAYMLSSRPGVTGIIMFFCLAVAYAFAVNRSKHFNKFWYTHHLLLVMLIAMCVHGTRSIFEPFRSIYWIIGPLVLYVIPRFLRETSLFEVDIVKMEVKKGNVVQLRLAKPKFYRHYLSSGMYGSLNVPQISRTEWHPFSFTSAPSDEFVEFHIRPAGDWTKKVKDLLESKADIRELTGVKDPPVVKVEGPIGASSQGFSDYPIAVLIGAGIGITPMISILRQLLVKPGKVRRCFFYWTVRDREAFVWFSELLDEIYRADERNFLQICRRKAISPFSSEKPFLQIRNFLTSVKQDDRDLGDVLIYYATRAHHKATNIDLLLGQRTNHQVQVGRPDWLKELKGVKAEAESLGETRCGIFFCGPTAMARSISDASVNVSRITPSFHMYFSKETF